MSNLFSTEPSSPLAHKLRPNTLEDIIGQKKAVSILKQLNLPVSMLFYGPPGTGKTTLALILCNTWKKDFYHISAISSGVKEVREIISIADSKPGIVLFLDEIHRFSSSQQDSLLESVEKGKIILIGATTENPGFRINRALLSRLILVQLESLSEIELSEIANKAMNYYNFSLDTDSIEYLIRLSGGDARKLLTFMETIKNSSKKDLHSLDSIRSILSETVPIYDRSGENHYDYISAFIKSVRGSDPDAAVFYLACMLEAGEDPIFIMRRLIILASEDIGNTAPGALSVAVSGLHSLQAIGMPEGRIILSQVTTYLASCPKSNASYLAIDKAILYVKKNGPLFIIPKHLRNAPTFVHKKEGASEGYLYPHEYDGFIQQDYFPEKVSKKQFYFPTENGQEKTLKERLKQFWKGWKHKNYL